VLKNGSAEDVLGSDPGLGAKVTPVTMQTFGPPAPFQGIFTPIAEQQPAATTLSLTCPANVTVKNQIAVSGTLTPAFAGAPVTVTYTEPNGSGTVVDQVTTDATGAYSDSTEASRLGGWQEQASFAGDSGHQASKSDACATIVDP
jgi:hypothetical protein